MCIGLLFIISYERREKMKLVLAEKPSVAQSIAKVIGAAKRCDGYLEGDDYVVSWCVGHLVELAKPEIYRETYAKWNKDDLPIIPNDWKYEVTKSTKKQFQVIKKLMQRSDIESLVCATDAGREGELIFRLVYHQCNCHKPFERLWISSMEDSAIKAGFNHLKNSNEYDSLYESALCRERADWIVGINATRLFSCLYGQTLQIGRVMTPTLGMVVLREAQITSFQSKPFYTLQLVFDNFTAISRKFESREECESIKQICMKEKIVSVKNIEKKIRKEKSPLLYDLTSLQRDANRLLGFTAQQTLDYTQNLYEKKLVTYPRTDSKFITEDMHENVLEIISLLSDKYDYREKIYAKQIVDNQKVSDHHAIIPTRNIVQADVQALGKGEKEILKMIELRLLRATAETFVYEETEINVLCCDETFKTKGKTVLVNGWKAIGCGDDKATKDEYVLPALMDGEKLEIRNIQIKEGKTTPPKHFTEDTLLLAMENAGSDESDEEAERRGIGTPATRAGIIEKLIRTGLMERKQSRKVKHLIPTEKGIFLITVVPEQIQSVSMTTDWEEKLLKIEKGNYSPDDFLCEIEEMMDTLVNEYEVVKGADYLMENKKILGICPHCGGEVIERQKGYFCENRDCRFVIWKEHAFFSSIGKEMKEQYAKTLLKDKCIELKQCISKRTGNTFDAVVVLSTESDGQAKFDLRFGKDEEA